MKNVLTKVSRALATVAIIVTATQAVSALEYRFKFKVTSSGPDMYACNAGLRTVPLKCDVCYKENSDGTKTPIDRPGSCSSTATNCGSRIKCISRGDSNGEAYMNYLTAGKRGWTDHSQVQGPRSNVSVRGAANAFQQIVAGNVAMDTKIEDLLFELGSEAYSAQYFVDICYRAPQHEFREAGIEANYNFLSNVGSTDFLSQGQTHGDSDRSGLIMLNNADLQRYTQQAGVKVQSYVVCDLQGQGVLQNATNAAGVYNTSENEADFVIGADGLPTGGLNGSFFKASDLKSLTGDALDMISTNFSNPRFCKTRYVFTETKGLTCNSGAAVFRDWTRKGAEMCTYTVIDEPAAE
ncbi:MAG: hypothetical protein WA160_12675 [Pseudobdellovibrio sp.]